MQLYGSRLFFAALFAAVLMIQFVWIRVKISPGQEFSDRLTDVLFSFLLALTIGTLFRLYPGNHLSPEWDSAVFLYIGRRMTEGKIPYLDLFDHKGPLLYLIEYLGCLLTPGSFAGVWVFEILSLFAALYISCRAVRLLTKENSIVYISLVLTYFLCGWRIWQGGNFSEEYALPWISAALYVFVFFFRNGSFRKRQIFILGVSFAAVFLLRANMVAIWIAWIPVVMVLLLRDKRFRELWSCVLLFLLGIIAVLLPTVLVAFRNGSLAAMWRCYIVFNFSYTDQVHSTMSSWVDFSSSPLFLIWPGLLAMVVCLCRNPKEKLPWYSLWFFAVSVFTVKMSGMNFLHYQIQMLPCFVLPFLSFADLTAGLFSGGKEIHTDRVLILVTCFLMLIGAVGFRYYQDRRPKNVEPVVEYLNSHTEPDDDVLVLGNNAWVYLAADRKTENRFFYQSPPIETSDSLYHEFLRELEEHPSTTVLTTFGETEVFYQGARLSEVCSMLTDVFGYSYTDYESFGVYTGNSP